MKKRLICSLLALLLCLTVLSPAVFAADETNVV